MKQTRFTYVVANIVEHCFYWLFVITLDLYAENYNVGWFEKGESKDIYYAISLLPEVKEKLAKTIQIK